MLQLTERIVPTSTQPAQVQSHVRFVGVSKSYDGRSLIVDNLHLDIRSGEFLTLLGPSGSGKTTCLMMLAGFERLSSGSIFINGILANRIPAYRRDVGVVFQNYALFPHMTVQENLAFPLRQRKVPANVMRSRVVRTLEMVRLGPLADRYPRQLSGGQQQRVALARALVFEPKLVLMDEPLGALDRNLREHMQVEIKQLHNTIGMTVVYVTHDQGEALTMSDRIAVLDRGRIAQIAAPPEVYERPATSFVANFVGANNVLIGTVRGATANECEIVLDGGIHVIATVVDPLYEGDAVEIAVRPERIELGPPPGCPNRIGVCLDDVIYYGDHMVVICRTSYGQRLQAKLPIGRFDPLTILEKGEKVEIGWQINAGRAFRRNIDGDVIC